MKHGGKCGNITVWIMTEGEKMGEDVGIQSNNEKSGRSVVPPHFTLLKGCFGNSDPTQIATTLSTTVT